VSEERITYCRICEPLCGLAVTVENGRVSKVRPDRDNPLSRGFACPKGIAIGDVQNDPDRVLYPLRRRAGSARGEAEFERVSWEEALDDIGSRLRSIIAKRGGSALALYFGNPAAFSYSCSMWAKGLLDAVGSPHFYNAGSQDVNNRCVASKLLYGSAFLFTIPDLPRTDFLLMLGANPIVSHGSIVAAPRIKDELDEIVRRGGRIVVVDPRRTETARAYEHLPVDPDSDAWLLLSLLQVIFSEGLEDRGALETQARGSDKLREMAAGHPPEDTEARTGVPAERVRQLARDLASAPSATVYGRCGTCRGRHATLIAYLIDALNLATGNLDRPGGAIFGTSPVPIDELLDKAGANTYGMVRSRIGGFPDVMGALPAAVMAKEITTPGAGQIRALFVVGGNPILSLPNGAELEAALAELELIVTFDLYASDTSQFADYVLPATTFLEREDFPLPFLTLHLTPYVQWTEPVVEPRGEARQEWEAIEEISRRIGVVPSSSRTLRALGRLGIRLSPQRMLDLLLRTSPSGDLFGLRRGGLSIAHLRRHPHGIVLGDHPPTGVLRDKVRHKDKLVRLDPPEILDDARRLGERHTADPRFPLRLIGMRSLRTQNSWMHNSRKLMAAGQVHAARIHPDDAEQAGIAAWEQVRISSATGAIELPALITDEIKRGTIAVPHGWGHRPGSFGQVAAHSGGANVNLLASTRIEDVEPLAGMTHLDGIPVRIEPCAPTGAD
jgi:formate dehydrogenase